MADTSITSVVNTPSDQIVNRIGNNQLTGTNKFGSTTNYTQFDTTGHQTMVGTAQPWDDIAVTPTARTTGTQAPTFEKWFDDSAGTSRGVYLYSFDNAIVAQEKEIFFTIQFPHSLNGDDIQFHIHWVAESTASTSKVRWGLEYTWKEPSAVYGDTTIIYADTDVWGATGTTQNQHTITSFTGLSPTTSEDGLSTILIGRVFRNSSNASDTYTGKVGLLSMDAHFQMARLGSDEEYTA
jgi:hypothetical protein